ncbi:hypothetical protein [Streptomyces sp.]|uniref:hypothetical protein n=1 Tax=Streptomyces sp. TaxID=1931 RepID=UPI002F4296B4
MTSPGDFAAASEAVDAKLFRIPGVSHTTLLELEELIEAREAARIRALPGFPGLTAADAADAIDPEMRRRRRQTPCSVLACPTPELAVLVKGDHGDLALRVREGDAWDRVDTVLLTTDDKLTIRYGAHPADGQQPVPPPVPGRGRLLAHVLVRAGATAVRPADITTYPWET